MGTIRVNTTALYPSKDKAMYAILWWSQVFLVDIWSGGNAIGLWPDTTCIVGQSINHCRSGIVFLWSGGTHSANQLETRYYKYTWKVFHKTSLQNATLILWTGVIIIMIMWSLSGAVIRSLVPRLTVCNNYVYYRNCVGPTCPVAFIIADDK